mmetsp:Transcript_69932/g.221563  ORF Transcript_69932/g.221563 Transcript_69932/m.221563 type:complete len:340 (-) Transcript_69932:1692-2711(-)
MPTPMCAALIIPTSLAPSPMPRVTAPALVLTRCVTCAFWMGDTRQHTTARQRLHSARKSSSTSGCSAHIRLEPSIITPTLPGAPVAGSAISSAARAISLRNATFSRTLPSTSTPSPASTRLMSSASRLQLSAMEHAVSSLSPVSIHTLMPAPKRSAMASGTPSCSLSSTAVAPRRTRSRSRASAASASISSRPVRETCARWKPACQLANSSSLTSRAATQSVRYPARHMVSMCAWVASRTPPGGCCAARRGNITLSAPLLRRRMPPPGARHTTLIRLRALVKSSSASTSYSRGTREAAGPPGRAPASLTRTLSLVRSASTTPSLAAPSTSASSSGEAAW